MVTRGDRQWLVYADGDRLPRLTSRLLPAGEWTTPLDLSQITGNPLGSTLTLDLHNQWNIGIDISGRLHIAGNTHNVALKYARTSTGADPDTLTPAGFATASMPSNSQVSYSSFFTQPDGTLFFAYREGGSGDGDWMLNTWDDTAGTWSSRQVWRGLIDGYSPYPHRFAIDPDSGVMHVLWCWREAADGATNDGLYYGYSVDKGVTWRRLDGTLYPSPIRRSTVDRVVERPAPASELLNQGGSIVDYLGRPHFAVNENFITGPVETWHHYVNSSGVWVSEDTGIRDATRVMMTRLGRRIFMVYKVSSGVRLRDVTDGPSGADTLLAAGSFDTLEPTPDDEALMRRGETHFLLAVQSAAAEASSGVTGDIATMFAADYGAVVRSRAFRVGTAGKRIP